MGCGSSSTTNEQSALSKTEYVTKNTQVHVTADKKIFGNSDTKTTEEQTEKKLNQGMKNGKPNHTIGDSPKPKSAAASEMEVENQSNVAGQTEVQNKPSAEVQTKVKPTKKEDSLILNFDDFKPIDDHARKAPKAVEESIQTLADYLTKPTKNALEAVRAIYVWICENISYNTEAYFGGNVASLDTKGEDVLKCKSSVCSGYAGLFDCLCLASGITSKKISGYAKGYGHQPGDVISYDQKTNHAWNVVEIDGKWRFVETTWGAGHVDKNKKFNKSFSNYYFLTAPEGFIVDHFPYINNNVEESKQWQLLENPISIEVFSKIIKPSKEARQYGVKFSSHPFEFITVKNDCSITVELTKYALSNIWYDINDSNGTLCNESVIVLKESNDKYNIKIQPRKNGRYELKLHATIEGCATNTTLVCYIIDCVSSNPDLMRYPRNRGYYGIKPDFCGEVFESSNIQPFYIAKLGEFELNIKTKQSPEVLVNLHDSDDIDQKDHTLLEQTDDCIHLRARFITKGYYKLTLFTKYGDNEKYSEAGKILIFSSTESEVKSPFPLTYSTTRKYRCRLLKPLVREIPANSDVYFEFESEKFVAVLVKPKVYQNEGHNWKITATTNESGELNLSGKPDSESSYWPVYGFVIKS